MPTRKKPHDGNLVRLATLRAKLPMSSLAPVLECSKSHVYKLLNEETWDTNRLFKVEEFLGVGLFGPYLDSNQVVTHFLESEGVMGVMVSPQIISRFVLPKIGQFNPGSHLSNEPASSVASLDNESPTE